MITRIYWLKTKINRESNNCLKVNHLPWWKLFSLLSCNWLNKSLVSMISWRQSKETFKRSLTSRKYSLRKSIKIYKTNYNPKMRSREWLLSKRKWWLLIWINLMQDWINNIINSSSLLKLEIKKSLTNKSHIKIKFHSFNSNWLPKTYN